MAAPTSQPRLRIQLTDPAGAVFDLGPEDVPRHDGPAPDVRPLRPTEADRAAGQRRFEVTVDGWVFTLTAEPEARARLRERAAQGRETAGPGGDTVIRAQIPGRVARVWVAEGDTVEAGQRLLAVEAMKMENEVRAPRGGTVVAIKVSAGGSVELGDELLTVS